MRHRWKALNAQLIESSFIFKKLKNDDAAPLFALGAEPSQRHAPKRQAGHAGGSPCWLPRRLDLFEKSISAIHSILAVRIEGTDPT